MCTPGGSVYLTSAKGAVAIGTNALINVWECPNTTPKTERHGVNAGTISIYSPTAPAKLQKAGALVGKAGNIYAGDGKTILATGVGGSFVLDTKDLSNISASGQTGFTALNTMLSSGGFTEDVNLRFRESTVRTRFWP